MKILNELKRTEGLTVGDLADRLDMSYMGIKELCDQVDDASKTEIESAIKDVRESLTSEDAADINARTERLQTAFHKVSEAMYERAQAQQEAASPNGGSADGARADGADAEEEVVDAEVVDDQQR